MPCRQNYLQGKHSAFNCASTDIFCGDCLVENCFFSANIPWYTRKFLKALFWFVTLAGSFRRENVFPRSCRIWVLLKDALRGEGVGLQGCWMSRSHSCFCLGCFKSLLNLWFLPISFQYIPVLLKVARAGCYCLQPKVFYPYQ